LVSYHSCDFFVFEWILLEILAFHFFESSFWPLKNFQFQNEFILWSHTILNKHLFSEFLTKYWLLDFFCLKKDGKCKRCQGFGSIGCYFTICCMAVKPEWTVHEKIYCIQQHIATVLKISFKCYLDKQQWNTHC
jgi:hypothetical protein